MPRDFDAIIIGGGHNGLVCAGYLARAGCKVRVLERRAFVGGATATEELFPGYRVSSCSYLCHVLQAKVIDDLELRQHGFHVFHMDPDRLHPFPDGRSLLVWDDLAQTQEAIGKFSTHDAKAFPRWMEFWKRAAGLVHRHWLGPPPSLSQIKAEARAIGVEHVLNRVLRSTMVDLVTDFYKDAAIRGVFINAQDVGDPAAPGSAWCYTHIRCDLFSRPEDSGIVRGGMGALAEALAASARAQGVTIETNCAVERILVERGVARGVRLADGRELSAHHVVSNADPKRTFLRLLAADDAPADFITRVQRLKTEAGYLKFHAALSRLPDFSRYFNGDFDPRPLAYMKICPSIDYFARSWADAHSGRPAQAPVMEVQIPTVYDDTLAAPGRHVMSVWGMYAPVRPVDKSWAELREPVGERILDLLAEYAPDLRDCVVDWSLFTPADLEERVALTDGNIRHLDIVPDQYLDQRPLAGWVAYATPIKNLWLCGAGTHPGGEVTGACGHNAAQAILAADHS